MKAPLLLGIEIGGTKLQMALGHGDGQILARLRRDVEPSRGALGIQQDIAGSLGTLRDQLGAGPGDVKAAGVGFGGPVECTRGVVVRSHQVAGWEGIDLAEWVRRDLGIPVAAVQNDSDTAALGEARFGAGRGLSPVLYANSGSGVGGGLIVEGRIYRGGSGIGALEIGHLRVFRDEARPSEQSDLATGSSDEHAGRTLEQVASGWAIGRAGARHVERNRRHGLKLGEALASLCGGDPDRVTARMVAEAALLGDEAARRILDDATTAFAQALAHAVTLLAPRRIVLGGGVSLIEASLWMDPIRQKLQRQVFSPFAGTYDVVPAALGEDIVVHGALALALDAWSEYLDPRLASGS